MLFTGNDFILGKNQHRFLTSIESRTFSGGIQIKIALKNKGKHLDIKFSSLTNATDMRDVASRIFNKSPNKFKVTS